MHQIQPLKESPKSKQARDSQFSKNLPTTPLFQIYHSDKTHTIYSLDSPPHPITPSLPPKQSAAMPTSDTDFDLSVRSLSLSLSLFHFHSLYVSLDSLSFLCSPLPHLPSQWGKFALISRVSYRFQNAPTLMLTLTVQRVYICWCE